MAVIDDNTLQIIARVPAGDYPDGIAYASKAKKLYVSDLHSKTDTVIDANTNQRLATIPLGGGAGNTQYDSASERVFVTVHGQNQIAEIDPNKDQVIGRYPLGGCSEPHGLLIDSEHRLAFVACEDNAKLAVFDLETRKMTAIQAVGADPDVLAFDKSFGRLYVSAESGIISILDGRGRKLEKVARDSLLPTHTACPLTAALIAFISHCRTLAESQSLESQCPLISSYDQRMEAFR